MLVCAWPQHKLNSHVFLFSQTCCLHHGIHKTYADSLRILSGDIHISLYWQW